jgi:hypothetical protein
LVATACGLVPIEEVQAGDWVWARDEVTGEVRLCEVEETYRNESPVIVEVTAGDETLATTPGHPFWVQDVGWKDAGDLKVGDHLVNLRGESVVVEDIRRRPVPEAVYNFSVAGLHTYFVGQGGIWVHNNSATGCGVPGVAGKAGDAAKKTDYSHIADPKNLHASTKPTPRQVREMKEANRAQNGGILRDDVTGEEMVDSAKSESGVTPPPNEVSVDHVIPVDAGGTRSQKNLELRTRYNNRLKSNKVP